MKNKSAPILLFVSLVIVMIGFGIVMPLMAFFVTHFNASGGALGLMMSLYSIMQFIFAPFWGRVSDRIGRKPVLLIGIAGYFVSFLLQAFSPTLWFLIASRTLAGILSSATLPTAMAYMADITTREDRSKGVGLMGAAMGLGMIIGPMLGGILSGLDLHLPVFIQSLMQITTDPSTGKLINLSIPFLVSSLLALITLPFIFLMLPESLKPEFRTNKNQEIQKESTFSKLINGLKGPLGFFFGMSFLLAFALANLEGVLSLYGKDNFNMGPAQIGYIMGAMGILSVIEQGLLIGPMTRKFGELKLLFGGLLISVIGLIGLSLFRYSWSMYTFTLIFASGNVLLQPSVTSLVSQRSSASEQGAAMGISNSFQSLGRAVGPLWAGFAYDSYSTLPFWSGAIFQIAALVLGIKQIKLNSPKTTVIAVTEFEV